MYFTVALILLHVLHHVRRCVSLLCTSWAPCGPLMISKQPLIRVAKSPLTYGIHCVFIFKKRLANVSFVNTGARNKKLFYRRFNFTSKRGRVRAVMLIQSLELLHLYYPMILRVLDAFLKHFRCVNMCVRTGLRVMVAAVCRLWWWWWVWFPQVRTLKPRGYVLWKTSLIWGKTWKKPCPVCGGRLISVTGKNIGMILFLLIYVLCFCMPKVVKVFYSSKILCMLKG